MQIHVLQHEPFEPPGAVLGWAAARGHRVTATHLYAGEALPPADGVDLLVVMGGGMSVHDADRLPWLLAEKRFVSEQIATSKPVLGICLGAQIIAECLGGAVRRSPEREIGWFPIDLTDDGRRSGLFDALPADRIVFHWHGETFDIPEGALRLAATADVPNQAFSFDGGRVVGLQFHCETTPAIIEGMVAASDDYKAGGRFVQSPADMLGGAPRCAALNRMLDGLLDHMAAGA